MMPRVPCAWPGETAVILATGPSLTPADVAYCQDRARVIAIKDSIQLAPFADVLYACDGKWWRHYGDGLRDYRGPRFALDADAGRWATVLRNTGEQGLETDPTGLRTGRNSGYQAINLAVHLGFRRLVLLGYDNQPGPQEQRNWFGPRPSSYWLALPAWHESIARGWPSMVAPLQALGVTVINATRATALACFPRLSLEEALA